MLTAALGCARVEGDSERRSPPFVLGSDEIQLARELAEARLGPASPERVFFIKADLLPETHAETGLRRVMVQHYRYDGDETVFTMVDLRALEVRQVEIEPHYPTALAAEENLRAEQLAGRDERVRPLLENGVRLDYRPIQASSADDPLFGHRVVHLMLRSADGYLSRPRVLVDLTTGQVHIAE